MIPIKKINAARDIVVANLLDKAKALQSLSFNPKTVIIDFSKIPEFQSTPSKKSGKKTYYREGLESMGCYNDIINDKAGAVYFFHLPSDVSKNDVIKALKTCKTNRAIPSIHNLEKRDKYDVLYVGSIKSHFFTRFYQHLGYGTQNTGALNLLHWAGDLFNEIKMTYYPIEHSHLSLHTLMEVAMCKAVTPMIGRMEKDTIKT